MLTFPKTTTVREIQRNYRKLFNYVKRTKKPILVITNNKPDVVIVDVKKLEEMEAINTVYRSYAQAQRGEAKELKSLADLWHEAQQS